MYYNIFNKYRNIIQNKCTSNIFSSAPLNKNTMLCFSIFGLWVTIRKISNITAQPAPSSEPPKVI